MTHRLLLTIIWLLGMAVCLVAVELYFRRTPGGFAFVFPDQRAEMLKPIATLYGGHIAAILGAWFTRPFKLPRKSKRATPFFTIALACTLIWNLGAIYLVGQRHVWPDQVGTLASDLSVASQFGIWFSFLVAPVNVYYFGIKEAANKAESAI